MPNAPDDRSGRRFPLPLGRLRAASAVAAPSAAQVQRPQRMVQKAADDAARTRVPGGLGLDSSQVRARMVQRLRAAGIGDERVLSAFTRVERHRFVDSALAHQAYEETSLPIGLGQTISKPLVVAQMLQALLQGRGDDIVPGQRPLRLVLEVGTGCGYQAALLACVCEAVVSIERLEPLARKARTQLAAAGSGQVQVLHGDGRLGAAALGPFDGIVSAAGGDDVPQAWLDQLAPGGRLVAPGAAVRPGVQELVVIDREAGGFLRRVAGEVYFVPLKSGAE
jgi:protein-L-isoaspartate(D-aspartate) O-methyltransferase